MAYYAKFHWSGGTFGRTNYWQLAFISESIGCDDGTFFYYNGDSTCYPHLMFTNEDDALLYALKYGAEIYSSPPLRPPLKDTGD